MNIRRYLDLATQVSRLKADDRTYFHGAVGVRRDGVLVAACNGAPLFPEPKHHCEYRLTRKLGKYGIVFLVRTLANGDWADSTPCNDCENRLIHQLVQEVYFTTGKDTWTRWEPSRLVPLRRR